MRFSVLDVVLVAIFLAAAIVGGACGVLGKELVAAIITAAVAFLAARGRALFDKTKTDADEKPADGAPDKPLEPGHSHKITIDPNGTVTVESEAPDEALPDGDALDPKEE